MKTLSNRTRSMTSLLSAIFLVASLYASPTLAQDEGDDVVIEDTTTTTEEPIDDSSETYSGSDE